MFTLIYYGIFIDFCFYINLFLSRYFIYNLTLFFDYNQYIFNSLVQEL